MKKRWSRKKLEKLLVDFTESLTGEVSESMELSSARQINSLSEETDDISSLLETVRTISSVMQPEQPSEEFIARVSHAAQERLEEQISIEKIERIIGMAVTDEDFRRGFFQDIVATCRNAGFDLTPREIVALRNLKEDAVKEFANSLDERITKFFSANLP
jgi:hypothetical protein